MSELINVPQYVEKKVMFVISCASYINDIQRESSSYTFCTEGIGKLCKYWKTNNVNRFRENIMFPINKYFSKFHFERGKRIIYNELFYVPTPLTRYKLHTPSLLEEDKNISRFVERKIERFPLNPKYLVKVEKFHYKTEYYEIREPLITYLEKKYPKKKLLIKELKKLFSTTKANCKDYDSYLEKKAKFLLKTTNKSYQNSLKR